MRLLRSDAPHRNSEVDGLLAHPQLVTHEQLEHRLAAIEARLDALEVRTSPASRSKADDDVGRGRTSRGPLERQRCRPRRASVPDGAGHCQRGTGPDTHAPLPASATTVRTGPTDRTAPTTGSGTSRQTATTSPTRGSRTRRTIPPIRPTGPTPSNPRTGSTRWNRSTGRSFWTESTIESSPHHFHRAAERHLGRSS